MTKVSLLLLTSIAATAFVYAGDDDASVNAEASASVQGKPMNHGLFGSHRHKGGGGLFNLFGGRRGRGSGGGSRRRSFKKLAQAEKRAVRDALGTSREFDTMGDCLSWIDENSGEIDEDAFGRISSLKRSRKINEASWLEFMEWWEQGGRRRARKSGRGSGRNRGGGGGARWKGEWSWRGGGGGGGGRGRGRGRGRGGRGNRGRGNRGRGGRGGGRGRGSGGGGGDGAGEVAELSETAYKYILSVGGDDCEQEDGSPDAFIGCLEENNICFKASEWARIEGFSEDGDIDSEIFEELENHYRDFDDCEDSTDGGGIDGGTDGEIEAEVEGELEVLGGGVRIPNEILIELQRGNYEAYFEWLAENGEEIDESKIEVFERRINRNSRYKRRYSRLISRLRTFYRREYRELRRKRRGGRGGNGRGGGSRGRAVGFKRTQIRKLEGFLGRNRARGLNARIKSDLEDGDYESFFQWMIDNDYNFKAAEMRKIRRSIGSEFIDEWETYYARNGGGRSGGGGGGRGRGGGSGRARFKRTQIRELEGFLGRNRARGLNSRIKGDLENGDYESFFQWMIDNDYNFKAAEMRKIRRSIGSEFIDEWETYYARNGGGGGGGGSGGGGSGKRYRRKMRRINRTKVRTLKREFRVYGSINKSVEDDLMDGNYESFFKWAVRNRVSRREIERFFSGDRDVLEAWIEYEEENGGGSGGGGPDIGNPDGGNGGDLGNEEDQYEEIKGTFEELIDGEEIPEDILDDIKSGNIDTFLEFCVANEIDITDAKFRSLQRRLDRKGFNKGSYKRVWRNFRSWYNGAYKRERKLWRNGGGGRFTDRDIRILTDAIGRRDLSRDVTRKLKNGNYEAFFKWASSKNVAIDMQYLEGRFGKKRFRGFERKWTEYKESGSGFTGDGRSLSGGALKAFKTLGSLPRDVEIDLASGDMEGFKAWMISQKSSKSISQSQFKKFLRRLEQDSDFDASLISELETWYETEYRVADTRGGFTGGRRERQRAFKSIKKLAGNKSVPARFKRGLESGNEETILRYLRDSKTSITRKSWSRFQEDYERGNIAISASLYAEIEGWYLGSGGGGDGGGGVDGSGNFEISGQTISDLRRIFNGNPSIPSGQRRRIENGDLNAFIEFARSSRRKYKIKCKNVRAFERKCDRDQIPSNVCDRIMDWFDEINRDECLNDNGGGGSGSDGGARCPDGSRGTGTFCGRGGTSCNDGFYCEIDPADRYAICCRKASRRGGSGGSCSRGLVTIFKALYMSDIRRAYGGSIPSDKLDLIDSGDIPEVINWLEDDQEIKIPGKVKDWVERKCS